MRLVRKARALAGVAGAVGVALLLYEQWNAGLALVTVAATIGLLVTDRAFPESLPDRAVQGSGSALAELVRDLNLSGRGFILPGSETGEASRLFIPARDARFEDAPTTPSDHALVKEGPSARGLSLTPPGAGLEAEWAETNGLPSGKGMEEAAWHVRKAFHAFSLGADVTLARSGNVVRVSFVPIAFASTTRAAREDLAPWHVQGADPATSFAAILVARAMGATVRLNDAGQDGARAWVDLEVAPPPRRGERLEVGARASA